MRTDKGCKKIRFRGKRRERMYASRVMLEFPSHLNKDERYELRDLFESYLYDLRKFGQIWGEFILTYSKEPLMGFAYLPHPDAIKPEYHSTYTQEIFENLIEKFGNTPTWETLDDSSEAILPDWENEEFLYVFTHAFDFTSPVCIGSTGEALPMYVLPLSDKEREQAYFWMSAYREHDRIWLASEALEIPAYKQLVEPESELSQKGRTIGQIIEQKTGIPTYYYLNRYWGRRKGEEQRVCPGCGNTWRVIQDIAPKEAFSNFPFRCEQCRLVSHEADSFEDERHARIGEYKRKKKKHM